MIIQRDRAARLERFNAFVANDRIMRGDWHGTDALGRETACLLGAFGRDIDDVSKCPADVMPAWLAHLTPDFNDRVSLSYWPAMVRDYASIANRWHVLDQAAWDRALCRTMIATLEIALSSDKFGVVTPVIALYHRWLAGDKPSFAEWRDAAESARAAESWRCSAAAGAAAESARAAARAAASAEAAEWAATATAAATAEVWDKISSACISAIAQECDGAAS